MSQTKLRAVEGGARMKREPAVVGAVEKGVPFGLPSRGTSFPFAEMDIGDSFTVENVAKGTILAGAKKAGVKVRVVPNDHGEGLRVGRIA